MTLQLAPQVVDFIRRLPPEPKRKLRKALQGLMHGQGDIHALEGPLAPYCRLRVGSYRIIFCYAKRSTIECVFAEQRSVVYELFSDLLRQHLVGGE